MITREIVEACELIEFNLVEIEDYTKATSTCVMGEYNNSFYTLEDIYGFKLSYKENLLEQYLILKLSSYIK